MKIQPTRKGFTLVELMVVITIIGIITALAIPCATSAMRAAYRAESLTKMRQIGTAFFAYASDNNMALPQRFYGSNPITGRLVGYDDMLLPYLNEDTKVFKDSGHALVDYPSQPSFGMNWYYDNAPYHAPQNPSTTILLACTAGPDGRGSHRADRDNITPGEIDKKRYGTKANYLFFDGSARSLTYEETVGTNNMWGEDFGHHDAPMPPGY